MSDGRCIYCGHPTGLRVTAKACPAHRDLLEVDPDIQMQRMCNWWLKRYTLPEIRELAAALVDEPIPALRQLELVA